MCGPLGPPVSDHGRAALDDLPGAALPVDLAEAGPLTQLHVAVHLDQGDAVLHAQRGDHLGHGIVAGQGQDAEQSPSIMGVYSSRKTFSLHMLRCYLAKGPETEKSQARPGVKPIKHPQQKMN